MAPVFYAGERLEVVPSPGWVPLLAAAGALGFRLEDVADSRDLVPWHAADRLAVTRVARPSRAGLGATARSGTGGGRLALSFSPVSRGAAT
jgi:hypothetical protein